MFAESIGAKEIILRAVKIPDTNTTRYKWIMSIKPVSEKLPLIQIA